MLTGRATAMADEGCTSIRRATPAATIFLALSRAAYDAARSTFCLFYTPDAADAITIVTLLLRLILTNQQHLCASLTPRVQSK